MRGNVGRYGKCTPDPLNEWEMRLGDWTVITWSLRITEGLVCPEAEALHHMAHLLSNAENGETIQVTVRLNWYGIRVEEPPGVLSGWELFERPEEAIEWANEYRGEYGEEDTCDD